MPESHVASVSLRDSDPGLSRVATALAGSELLRPVRLAVASAVRLVREGLGATLRGRPGIAELRAFTIDGDGLLRIAHMSPDVILVDMAGTTSDVAARTFRHACPAARLVAFALTEIDHEVFACAASGFAGYVSKDGGADDLHRAVLDAAHDRMQCAPHITAALFSRLGALLRAAPQAPNLAQLTARENKVLSLAGEGHSNKEIARLLLISNATVKNHMHNILQKLQVNGRGQAVAQTRNCDRISTD